MKAPRKFHPAASTGLRATQQANPQGSRPPPPQKTIQRPTLPIPRQIAPLGMNTRLHTTLTKPRASASDYQPSKLQQWIAITSSNPRTHTCMTRSLRFTARALTAVENFVGTSADLYRGMWPRVPRTWARPATGQQIALVRVKTLLRNVLILPLIALAIGVFISTPPTAIYEAAAISSAPHVSAVYKAAPTLNTVAGGLIGALHDTLQSRPGSLHEQSQTRREWGAAGERPGRRPRQLARRSRAREAGTGHASGYKKNRRFASSSTLPTRVCPRLLMVLEVSAGTAFSMLLPALRDVLGDECGETKLVQVVRHCEGCAFTGYEIT